MTDAELKETGLALIAMSEGREVEYSTNCGKTWNSRLSCSISTIGSESWTLITPFWRIKPEPKMRLITKEEMPFVFAVRRGIKDLSPVSVIDVMPHLLDYWAGCEWTTDGKTWHSFYVEDKS